MTKNFKYILFDWDGCLVMTLHVWLNAYREVFKIEGLYPTDEEIVAKAFSQREKGMENIGSIDPNASWAKVVQIVNKDVINVPFYDGVMEMLENLKKDGIKMALLTQSDRGTIMPVIEKRNLNKYFEIILTKDDVANKKPDPEIVLMAMEKMGAKNNETLIVGDSYHDIQCGKNAGIKTCAYYPPENEKFYTIEEIKKENPDYLIRNFSELSRVTL
jgi:pyrophosphatase PpaX